MRRRWTEVRRTFTPPRNSPVEMTGVDDGVMQRAMFGFTVIEYADHRNRPRFRYVLGDQTNKEALS